MGNVFRNPHLSLHSKKLIYMAIPMNLLLWGCETWALKASDWRFLQVFHSKAIRRILNISMTEVQAQHISNSEVYKEFVIDPVEDIIVSRQARWIGKIAEMEESRMPRKMISAWVSNPRPVGRPLTTIRHTYLHVLRRMGVIDEDDKTGLLRDWIGYIKGDVEPTWAQRRQALTPNLIGRREDLEARYG